jgi:hypothetical protein
VTPDERDIEVSESARIRLAQRQFAAIIAGVVSTTIFLTGIMFEIGGLKDAMSEVAEAIHEHTVLIQKNTRDIDELKWENGKK